MLWSQKLKLCSKLSELNSFSHKCLLPDVILNEGVNKLTRRKHFLRQKFLWTVWEMSLCRKNVSITHRGSFVLFSFYGESKWKWKWLDSQCGSALGVEIHIFFADLRMFIGLLEYFDLLSSVYNSNIIWFFIFCVSSSLKNILGNISRSSF